MGVAVTHERLSEQGVRRSRSRPADRADQWPTAPRGSGGLLNPELVLGFLGQESVNIVDLNDCLARLM